MIAIVWSQDNCAYCDRAKKLLASKEYHVQERNISSGTWSKADLVRAVPGARSVPQIFIGDRYIGGFDDLVKAIS